MWGEISPPLSKGGFMTITVNGKVVRINEQEVEKIAAGLGISKQEAIQVWLEDNEYIENAEQVKLDTKAKSNRITATIHQAKAINTKKTQRERVLKDDPTKENLIKCIKVLLEGKGCEKVEIVNKTKLISFTLGGETFKLDLIRQRNK